MNLAHVPFRDAPSAPRAQARAGMSRRRFCDSRRHHCGPPATVARTTASPVPFRMDHDLARIPPDVRRPPSPKAPAR
jgi:hypothetical protein